MSTRFQRKDKIQTVVVILTTLLLLSFTIFGIFSNQLKNNKGTVNQSDNKTNNVSNNSKLSSNFAGNIEDNSKDGGVSFVSNDCQVRLKYPSAFQKKEDLNKDTGENIVTFGYNNAANEIVAKGLFTCSVLEDYGNGIKSKLGSRFDGRYTPGEMKELFDLSYEQDRDANGKDVAIKYIKGHTKTMASCKILDKSQLSQYLLPNSIEKLDQSFVRCDEKDANKEDVLIMYLWSKSSNKYYDLTLQREMFNGLLIEIK
jgi:hypothetical protein